MLPPSHRLRRASDLRYVRLKGRRWSSGLFVLIVAPRHADLDTQETRFAIVAGRRVGNAVARNRLKRRMREIVRHQLPEIRPGFDCMLIARTPASQANFTEMEADILSLLGRASLIVLNRPVTVSE